MFFRQKITWSCLEADYLKTHMEDTSIMELAAYMSKSVNALKKKIKEIKTGVVDAPKGKRTNKGTRLGKRPDLGITCRSGWEANYLRFLKSEGLTYEYESETFMFTAFGITHGNVSYTPDIKVYRKDGSWYYIEIKGFLDKKDQTKLNRFKKFYPEEFKRLHAVVGSSTNKTAAFFKKIGTPIIHEYNKLNKQYKDIIPLWE